MKQEIKPFIGFDEIRFGQTQEQLESILGKPTCKSNETHTDNSWEVNLMYKDIGVEFTFSSDDEFLLGTISFFSNEFTFHGIRLIGLNEKELIEKVSELKILDFKLDDDFKELNSKDYFSDSNGMSFWLKNGKVDSITLYPKYNNDNNTPIWPE